MLSDRFVLGIDIGGTHFRIGLADETGSIYRFEKRSTAILSGNAPVSLLGDIIESYLQKSGAKERTVAVCIGFPATVDKARKTVLSAPNVQGFDGVPVGEILSARLSLPVLIERDVNLLLLADLKRLAISCTDVLGFYIGTGIGNAILLDGKLLLGHNGVAGELGHIPFGDENDPCGCGNRGCAEPLVGGLYLARLCRETFRETPIEDLFTRHGEHPLLRAYVERLGRVIATEVNLFDPEAVILGGGVPGMCDFPLDTLKASVLSHTRKPLPHDNLKFYSAPSSSDTCGIVGANILARRKSDQ